LIIFYFEQTFYILYKQFVGVLNEQLKIISVQMNSILIFAWKLEMKRTAAKFLFLIGASEMPVFNEVTIFHGSGG
jgi:predicted DNA-binding transcriptional regulator